MIELVYSNQTEQLLDSLAADLKLRREQGAHPLDPVELVVPNRNMETWVRFGLAQEVGVAANLRFRRLERFIGEIIAEACSGESRVVDLDTIEAAVLAVFLDQEILDQPDLLPVRRYLESTGPAKRPHRAGGPAFDTHLAADGADIRRVQLASRMAYLFQEYTYSRPEMIAAWRESESRKISTTGYSLAGHPYADPAEADPTMKPAAAWQKALWRAVFGSGGILEKNPPAGGGRWTTLDLLAYDDNLFEQIKTIGLPPVHIFGISYVARIFQLLFARLGRVGTLRIYTLNPCAEFWEDVETEREYFHRLDRELDRRSKRLWKKTGEPADEDPFGLFEADTPALRYWGRPGREHVRLLGELTDCDFTGAFDDPMKEGGGLLHRLQQDILRREPERTLEKELPGNKNQIDLNGQVAAAPCRPDDTIKLVAAPSVRREVEWVADEIWKLIRDDKPGPGKLPLRFSDIAVIVNSAERDVYLPQIETVFASCHNLPGSVSDLPGTAGSRLVEAMSLLLKLPFGRFSRAEMLTMMSHPAVIGRFDDLRPEDLAARAEALGIYFGADHTDHAGTYIDEDVFNWDQGIRRLALGAFMTGDKSGDDRIFEAGGGRWLVEEVSGSDTPAAARFGLLARSLISDARFVRENKMTLTDWARFYAAQIDAYFNIEDGTDARDRLRLLRSLYRLETMDLGHRVSGRVAAEIASRAIDSLGGGRGQYLAEGVVVSSFLPMRAIPFKVVFVLGLGEGLFPASGRRDALDLRAARRRAGDVDTAERDRYMFLETLLCTRERLYLSYVRRDEQTGDPLQPSAVVQELLHILQNGYLGREGLQDLRVEPPLRRHDQVLESDDTFIDEAKIEARVQKLSASRQKPLEPADEEQETADLPLLPGTSESENELNAIRQALSPHAWEKLAEMLILPGDPPPSASVTAAARGMAPNADSSIEETIDLPLSSLRRFLECPMQGWAAAMLGLSEMEEDRADREEEDFEVGRLLETMLLREVFTEALAGKMEPEKLYRQKTTRLRLAGQIPVGALGRVIEKRHLDIMAGWQFLLGQVETGFGLESDEGQHRCILQRARLGRSSRQCSTELTFDPLILEIELSGPEGQKRMVPVRISGLTEGLLKGRPVSVTFQPKKPPGGAGKNTAAGSFRYFLRGIVDQALLAAAGALDSFDSGDRQILVCYSGGEDKTGLLRMRLQPLSRDKARSWLSTLAADLLGGPHAYLLPCEAVIEEFYEQLKALPAGGKSSKGSLFPGPVGGDINRLINGESLRERVKALADFERSRFSSLWGPVPSPRLYSPPEAGEAVKIVLRRFGPLFEDMLTWEALK